MPSFSLLLVDPVKCIDPGTSKCNCYYSLDMRINVYNCSSIRSTNLPNSIPSYTEMISFTKNPMEHISQSAEYFSMIIYLDLRDNRIVSLPKYFKQLQNLEKVWLSGNTLHCDCSMTWMIGWLNNYTIISREHIVVDYKDVKCYSGKEIGHPIYLLDKVKLGCYPNKWTLKQKALVGLGTGVALLVIGALLSTLAKRNREVKFFMYYYLKLDTVSKDDKDEDLTNKEYDASFCYR